MKEAQSERVVIVTGGSGALGRANLARFLAAGDRVVVPWIAASERDAIETEEARALAEGRLVLVRADLAEESGARAAAEALPGAEVLVNGAGGFAGGPSVHETELEVWERRHRINLRTAVAMSRAVLPGMIARGRGAIVNVGSRAAYECPPGLAAYAAAKSGVHVRCKLFTPSAGPCPRPGSYTVVFIRLITGLRLWNESRPSISSCAARAKKPSCDW